jgi:CTP:molybdopterin cytidylyltransferase MocA
MSRELISQSCLIILSAGRSSRAGVSSPHKGLRLWPDEKGVPLFRVHFEKFLEAGGGSAVLVLGHRREEFDSALEQLRCADATSDVLKVVINPDPDRGPFSSIQGGLSEGLKSNADWFWILPVDTAPNDAFEGITRAVEMNLDIDAFVPEFEGRGGHPILISRGFAQVLCQSDAGHRLDHLLMVSKKVKRVIMSDSRILSNLND